MPESSHNSNFAFLADHDERLAKIGYEAEQLASISPTACMMQVRLLAELLAKETAAYVGIYLDEGATFYQVLSRLERNSAFHDDIKDLFHEVRMNAQKDRNQVSRRSPFHAGVRQRRRSGSAVLTGTSARIQIHRA